MSESNEHSSDEATGSEGKVTLKVDDTICMGIGQCELLEPEVFMIDDDAISRVVGDATFTGDRAKEIIMACPSGAIGPS